MIYNTSTTWAVHLLNLLNFANGIVIRYTRI